MIMEIPQHPKAQWIYDFKVNEKTRISISKPVS
jgi:hypothetical protein